MCRFPFHLELDQVISLVNAILTIEEELSEMTWFSVVWKENHEWFQIPCHLLEGKT